MTLEWRDVGPQPVGEAGCYVCGYGCGHAWADGYWCVFGTATTQLRSGQATTRTLDAAKAAMEAELWARAAEGLVGG